MDAQPILNPGAVPSKPDYRADLVAAAVAAQSVAPTLPIALQTNFQKFGILNQAQEPACVSHAMANLMKLWYFLKTGQIVNFSARFLHNISGLPQYNGGSTFGPEDGRDPMTVAKMAFTYGCATEATCPNDTTLPTNVYFSSTVLTPAMMTEAAQYKIPGYVPVQPTQLAIRQAIQKYGAVSLLMQISNSFWTDVNGNTTYAQAAIDPVRAPQNASQVIGGHELTGSGWNSSVDHLVNSWSNSWAQQGESDYIFNEWQNYIIEGVAIAEVDTATLNLVQGLPPAGEFKHNFVQTLTQGQTSTEVRALQIALAIDGDFVYPSITEFYGPVTAQAVSSFQKKYGIPDTGTHGTVVGPLTKAKLNSIYNN